MKLLTLCLCLIGGAVFADSDKTLYSYQYDSDGYVNHQVSNTLEGFGYGIEYNHNETYSPISFYYDTFLATKKGEFLDTQYKVGVGSLSGLNWSAVPIYYIDLLKDGFNLNISRDPRPSGSASISNVAGSIYSKMYSDSITLTYEFQPIQDVSVVLGGRHVMFEDGVDQEGLIFKGIYQINDNISLQYHHLSTFSDIDSTLYFNRRQTSFNRFLLSYTQPLLNDSLVVKVLVGPSVTEINRRRELVPHHEEKIIYRVANAVRLEANHLCIYTTFDYHYCQVGGNIEVSF